MSGNSFPQYHLRNADGIHDNELASYRAFRGGQGNANYLININNPEAAHPFLDLMNVGAIIFDSRQGTTYMPIPTAMGEAYLYGEAVVMSDEEAIQTLKTKAAIRKPKAEEPAKVEADSAVTDSAKAETASAEVAKTEAAEKDDPNAFYYREKLILSEAPATKGEGGIPQGYAKLVESPKMDTQVFQVESDRAGFIVVAGNYHPYWHATVNGAPAKVYKAFGTLRAVEIPKGKSEVRMEFRSTPFHACVKVSLVAAILLIAVGVGTMVMAKK